MDSKSPNVDSRATATGVSSALCSPTTTRPPSTDNIRQPCPLRNKTRKEMWTVEICPTIGGPFQLRVHAKETIEGLKKSISRYLKIPKDKISLLHKESILQEGQLAGHGVCDGSRLQLLPSVESGLVTPKNENTVLQALENLSEGQVQEFLSGKSPLTLAMRLGDHMMFVQLQLSTNTPSSRRPSLSTSYTKRCGNSSETAAAPTVTNVARPGLGEPCQPLEACSAPASPTSSDTGSESELLPALDNRALAQAKRNLSQKLKEISQLQDQAQQQQHNEEEDCCSKGRGAVIESMQHLGQGVYSGTFSGALNPALQDQEGRPKRSISTIIHILNDLLGASPQYRAHLHSQQTSGRHRARRPHTAGGATSSGAGVLTEENQATRGKMEQIQQRLQERRQRRQARRHAARSSPYATSQ